MLYNKNTWRRTEVVVPGRTRNAFVVNSAREFESHRLRQSELRSHTQFFYFCLKGIPAIIIPTIKFMPKQSFHYLNLKRDEHGNWIK